MPLIDIVGRKSPKVIGLFAIMYTLLVLGGITMVFPFIIMLSSSMTDEVDYKDYKMIPEYFYNDEMLFRKYIADKYTNPSPSLTFVNERYGEKEKISKSKMTEAMAKREPGLPIEFAFVPMADLNGYNSSKMLADWREFTDKLPLNYKMVAFRRVGNSTGPLEQKFREWAEKKYKTVEAMNQAYTTQYLKFSDVRSPVERLWERAYTFDKTAIGKDYTEFKSQLPPEDFFFVNGDGPWKTFLRMKFANKSVDDSVKLLELNTKYKTNFTSFNEIVLAPTLKEEQVFKEEWKEYAKNKFPIRYMSVSKKAEPEFRKFLKEKYKTVKVMSEVWNEKIASFDSVKLLDNLVEENRPQYLSCMQEFVAKKVSPDLLTLNSTENLYRQFLKEKYKDILVVNKEYKTEYKSFGAARVMYQVFDTAEFYPKKSELRRYFIGKNYGEVTSYILLHGRAVLNTIIYVTAVILVTLTINPMCAYALSRFKLSYGNKVLLFLLATMAFPAEVGMIPGFLLLKNFHLLNTYWALILPGLANGFSIFILKGFFDSLPKEFYEAAEMDGAGELKIFFNITLPLAKPVLAYLTIGAFAGAYGAFMFAMLVCQDPNMWTIMVWLYQMWEWAPQHVRMAAYVIASIPTLLVFIFAQRIIMRGIIIPVQH